MKKITLYRNQKSRQSHNFTKVVECLKHYEYNYGEASFEEPINNHFINLFFLTDDLLKNYLDQKRYYFKFGFSNFLILESDKHIDFVNSKFSFKQIGHLLSLI